MAHLGKRSGRSKGHAYEAKSSGKAYSKVSHDVAHVASRTVKFRYYARVVYAEVLREMAGHTDSGKMMASISLEKGEVDYAIVSDGIGYNWHTEFGHYMGSRELGDTRQWVPGINVFRNVVARHGGF